jgi:hypothetical protein
MVVDRSIDYPWRVDSTPASRALHCINKIVRHLPVDIALQINPQRCFDLLSIGKRGDQNENKRQEQRQGEKGLGSSSNNTSPSLPALKAVWESA